MRKAVLYNFLLEATIIASIAIVLMLIVRKLLRKQLGSRVIAFAWLLVAIRLLCPLTLPNPAINEIRSPFASDQGIRPIAGQVQVRVGDFFNELDSLQYRYDWDDDSLLTTTFDTLDRAAYSGSLAKWLVWLYIAGAICTAAWFLWRNIRFRHALKADRVEAISGKVEMDYHHLCLKRKVKSLPVYYTDPLPSACLVGVFQPYIALPLTSKPDETIHVLDHELCHYKGRDHIWGLVRLLCCVVHWFNPLVWLAASLSMTDCELACDERVVKGLNDEERKEYAGVLVLAAARKNAPGLPVLATGMTMTGKKLRERVRHIVQNPKAIRRLAIGFAVLACVLLVFAFATSEQFPNRNGDLNFVSDGSSIYKRPISSAEDAERYAKEIWGTPHLGIPVAETPCSVQEMPGGYVVCHGTDDILYETGFAPDGTLLFLNATKRNQLQGEYEGLTEQQLGITWDVLAEYALSFLEYASPGEANRIEAFSNGSGWRIGDCVLTEITGETLTSRGVKSGYVFVIQLQPETRLLSYQMNQEAIARHWQEGIQPLALPEAHRVCGMVGRSYTADETSLISTPTADTLPLEDALAIAQDTLMTRYGETPESLQRFTVKYKYYDDAEASYEYPRWQFDFQSAMPIDFYQVNISSPDGEVLFTCCQEEGNG